jgi:hypothetical protein
VIPAVGIVPVCPPEHPVRQTPVATELFCSHVAADVTSPLVISGRFQNQCFQLFCSTDGDP